MVNPGKRMKTLQPLLRIRNGKGAALLPPLPAPQLTNLHLRLPVPAGGIQQAHPQIVKTFWKGALGRLKFHNPALPITVERYDGFFGKLTLTFRSEDEKKLKALPGSVDHNRAFSAARGGTNTRRELETQSLESRESQGAGKSITDAELEELEKDKPSEGADKVIALSQPAVDPASPASVQPPNVIYERTVTLGLYGRTFSDMWFLLKTQTGALHLPQSEEDRALMKEIETVAGRAGEDRIRVKKGVDAMKKEEADLKRARGEAEKLQAETL